MVKKVSHNVEGVVVLQNCLDILKSEPGSIIETCQVSCDDGNQIVGIKVEDVTDVKEEEDSWPATSTGIKTEPAVSHMCVCVCIEVYAHWTDNVRTVHRITCEWKIYCFSGQFALSL